MVSSHKEKLRVNLSSLLGTSEPPAPSQYWQTENCQIGVDEKSGKAGVVWGCVIAQAGDFKSEGRGAFDESSLNEIIKLWPTSGCRAMPCTPTNL